MLIYRAFQSDICTSLCSFTELHEVLAEKFQGSVQTLTFENVMPYLVYESFL